MSVRRDLRRRRASRSRTAKSSGTRSTSSATRIDAELVADDVRLTMGGEPTFVAVDDPTAPEWNTAAARPDQARARGRAHRAAARTLRAAGGCCTSARASGIRASSCRAGRSRCFWRRDGEPIWADAALIADEHKDYGVTADTRARFSRSASRGDSSVDASAVAGATRTPGTTSWQERRLPENVDPLRTSSTIRWRVRGSRACSSAAWASRPATFCPCSRWNAKAAADPRRWVSAPWTTRAGKLFLVPGDSPLGFRLPLRRRSPCVGRRVSYPHVDTGGPVRRAR